MLILYVEFKVVRSVDLKVDSLKTANEALVFHRFLIFILMVAKLREVVND